MQWVCDICGYVHDEDEPPDSCPVCGAPKSKFSEFDEEGSESTDDDDDDEDEGEEWSNGSEERF
ncbi:MAG: hypothetical protein SGI97_02845 [candidate division Zixibacteria bacterium]|nr:hypothetical protein [candidate division Zixibacteria bacterium]